MPGETGIQTRFSLTGPLIEFGMDADKQGEFMTHPLRMRFRLPLAAAIVAALALPAAAAADDVVPGQVLVRYEPGSSAAERADVRKDTGTKTIDALGLARAELLKIADGDSVSATVRQLEAEPDVAYAEPNQILRPAELFPNDPDFLAGDQWGLLTVDAPAGWDFTTGSADTVVAVMDTGADLEHPDLDDQLWTNAGEIPANGLDDDGNGYIDDINGYDFYDSDPVPSDVTGHGTHVSGIALAEGNNAEDIAGVSWDASLMSLRICSSSYINGCPLGDLIDAMEYAADNDARVLNGSIEGGTFSEFVQDAAEENPQTLFVFAAGNSGANNDVSPRFPCAIDQYDGYSQNNVICVAATDQADGRASFSNYGASSVDLGAPGVGILSTSTEKLFLADDFEVDDFATEWTNSVSNTQDWARASETPLTSFGITDSPGSDYAPNAFSEVTSVPVTLPAGYSSCELHYYRSIKLGAGDEFEIGVLLDGVRTEWRTFTGPLDSVATTSFKLNPAFDDGGQVQVRLRLDADATDGADGVHMDNFSLFCFGSPSDHGTELLNGTSMATPMVTGAAALLFSYDPGLNPSDAKTKLLSSVDPVSSLSNITVSGGRLNVHRALIDDFNPAGGGGPGSSGASPSAGGADGSSRKPNTFFKRKPGKVVRTPNEMAKVVFRFGSSKSGSSFRCRLDSPVYVPCEKKLVRFLEPARHVLKVKAVDSDGAIDPTPAVAKFRVKQVRD